MMFFYKKCEIFVKIYVLNPDNTKHNLCFIRHLVLPDKIRYNDFAGVPCMAGPYCNNDFVHYLLFIYERLTL